MKILFLILFLLTSVIHLFGCLPRKNHSIAKYTKPLLMPLLVMAYGFSAETPSLLLILGLVFSCLGNCLLLHPENGMFVKIAYICHGVSLLLPSAVLLGGIGFRPAFWVLLLAVVGFAGLLAFALYRIGPYCPKPLSPFVCILSVSWAILGLTALLFAFTNPGFGPKLTIIGALFLMICGLLHYKYRFQKRFRFGMFTIMTLFLTGQSIFIFSLKALGGN